MWPFNILFGKKRVRIHRTEILLLTCQIHGSHYYGCLEQIERMALRPGQLLRLQREPDNQYDTHAIEVYSCDGVKLGYVPKYHNSVIAALMDQNCDVSAAIDVIHTTAWEPVTINIYCEKFA